MLVGSLLTKEHSTGWLYTANAVSATSPSELCKREAFASLSSWIIASHPKPQQFEKLDLRVSNEPCVDEKYYRRRELARKRLSVMFPFCSFLYSCVMIEMM